MSADDSTLFICSGMQPHKKRFCNPDGGRRGSLQSCIRTDDIELVGDGSHLTYFEMIGNFSFGNNDYEMSVELWHSILHDFQLSTDDRMQIHYHPDQIEHQNLWANRGYRLQSDKQCVWSDGEIGGYCCEVYFDGLEIGNLVNPMGHSTDVGFGWERLIQVIEGKQRVDKTSLFQQNCHPIIADHLRAISVMRQNGIHPGPKGHQYVCRRILRRMLRKMDQTEIQNCEFSDWLLTEQALRQKSIRRARKHWHKNRNNPPRFWWETFGVLPEEIELLEN